jgi:hypothetical protein
MNPQLIEEIAALVLQLGPLAVDLIVKLEGSMNLGPDDKTNIANAITASDQADADTITRVNAWLAANPAK